MRTSPLSLAARASLLAIAVPAALLLAAGCCASKAPVPTASLSAAGAGPAASGIATPEVDRLLRRACYDCHSSEGAPPWNAKLAFSYWFPNDSLKSVNFSEWATYDAKRQGETRKAIADVVRSGDMPPIDYRVLHPSAKLTKDEAAAVVAWAEAPGS